MPKLFSPHARWIWGTDNALEYNVYLRAHRSFRISASAQQEIQRTDSARLRITADFAYQAWINGFPVGHGPAKSPEGERHVDDLPISHLLRAGRNTLELLVLGVGTGTMTYALGEAGVIFEITAPGLRVSSDEKTSVRRDPQRRHMTTRRWVLPCVEDVDARANRARWKPATIIVRSCRLTPRPVELPSRRPASVQRVLTADYVRMPNFQIGFRIKPYLAAPEDQSVTTVFERDAFIVTDIHSAKRQTITFTPAPGQITWYFEGRKIIEGSGWGLWRADEQKPVITLRKGTNRLIGIHHHNFFDDIHLAGFAESPIRFCNPYGRGGFQVVLPHPNEESSREGGVATSALEGVGASGPDKLPPDMEIRLDEYAHPPMHQRDTLPDANCQSLAVGAVVQRDFPLDKSSLYSGGRIQLPASRANLAPRAIVDLGAIENGWLRFRVHGKAGSRLLFSFFEGINSIQPFQPHWPEACNNIVSYRLRDGWQEFESFLPYGVRYIAIHHEGAAPINIANLAVLSASCARPSQCVFLSDDLALNALHAMCERTVFAATDDTMTDCPTYEAVNWNFDNRLGAMGDLLMGRNTAIIRNTLAQYSRDPLYPGLVRSHYPSSWDVRIPVFSFHWIIACGEYFRHTNDRHFLKEMAPTIARGFAEAESYLNSDGLLEWPGGKNVWHIVDWQKQRDDTHAIVSAEQALFLGALDAALELGKLVGTATQLARWSATRERLRAAIQRSLWVPKRDAFADSIHSDGTLSAISSEPSNAALALHGAGSTTWRKRLAARLASRQSGLLPFGSPMGLFYILELLDQHGEQDALFRIIREKWVPMLQAGDGTAWEHFPEYGFPGAPTRSRCHPFAAYIIKYFTKYALGVVPVDTVAGCYRFQPRPPFGMEKCAGILPTAFGDIRASWFRESGSFHTSIETPKGITILP